MDINFHVTTLRLFSTITGGFVVLALVLAIAGFGFAKADRGYSGMLVLPLGIGAMWSLIIAFLMACASLAVYFAERS